jgi:hypothetical protein
LDKRRTQDVSQQVPRFHKVIARIQVAIMFQGNAISASRAKDAQGRLSQEPRGKHAIYHLYENAAHIVSHPFVEDSNEELSVLKWFDGAIRNPVALLNQYEPVIVNSFDNRNELEVARFQLVS